MALTTYEPWSLMNQLHSEINRMFDHRLGRYNYSDDDSVVTTDWVPAVDIREQQDSFILKADLPGVDPKDIEVTMENGMLTIRGERRSEETRESDGYHRVERISGQFYRRFTLPDTADSEGISARGNNGVLEITIPKHAKTQPRKINVEH
ncbi:MAG TPA: Hsp20/alpha crystallin family protein [Gammaproteobacteria bacterium]|nr:Hsp20/alpha crystallin family protein [Gammaproteobacteria bacterium]